jgi:hypothetical protein
MELDPKPCAAGVAPRRADHSFGTRNLNIVVGLKLAD